MLIPHRLFGVTEQLPASGAHTRVDTGKGAGQSHRTGGNAQTWHFAARHIEDFVATGQVGETWCEANECDRPCVGAVPCNDLRHGNTKRLGYVS